jgi:glycosyltransferase involved in cell wall biosynthesis
MNQQDNNVKLSICIPTYNRAELLRECLASVIPQVHNKAEVEVIVSDNASPDHTPAVVEEFQRQYPILRAYRNSTNLGYTGNQIKCFEHAAGNYLAILCDDDLYRPGLVDRLLAVLDIEEYAFVALNYFSFQLDVNKPFREDFAPARDVKFSRAYDVLNYPSVGHYSGYIFNTRLGRNALAQSTSKRGLDYFEKNRGIIGDIAARSTAASTLPSFFIGSRLLAARMPASVDYDTINHCCLDYYAFYRNLFDEGVITTEDLAYRRQLVLAMLPRAVVVDSYRLTNRELADITHRLSEFFAAEPRFKFICMPMLMMARSCMIKGVFRFCHAVRRYLKWRGKQ